MATLFQKYGDAGFLNDLLPIIPPNAKLDPAGPSYANLLVSLGKIPGTKVHDLWVGRAKWTERSATRCELNRWHDWGAGIGMQGRNFPAIDIDVDDPAIADLIHDTAIEMLGSAPVRFGNGARRILVYRCEGLRKQRLQFRMPHNPDAADEAEGAKPKPHPAVELLGDGQQYVVEGIHPRTGMPYRWDGDSPADIGPSGLTEVTPEQLDAFFTRVAEILKDRGCEEVAKAATGVKNAATVPQASLLAPSIDHIARALAAVPNDEDYGGWITVGMAIKASAGPDREPEGQALWEDWSLQYPNDPAETLAKWKGFTSPFKVRLDLPGLVRDGERRRQLQRRC